jgi:hypothetical protein
MIHEFSLLYFDEKNQEEKRVQGYLSADDISFAADIIMDEIGDATRRQEAAFA